MIKDLDKQQYRYTLMMRYYQFEEFRKRRSIQSSLQDRVSLVLIKTDNPENRESHVPTNK